MNAVAQMQDPQPIAAARPTSTHSDLLVMLIERNAPIEAIERYMDLADRNERTIARREYNAALADFRGESVRVVRSREVSQGPLKGTLYAVLSDFVNATAPELAKFGLSAAWKITRDEKEWIEVGCIVRHRGGHEEMTTMGGAPDVGGAKNSIQARASTISYLEKYTIKMALGLAEQNDDDDGAGGAQEHQAPPPRQPEPPVAKQPYPEDRFAENLPSWRDMIESGKKTHAAVIGMLSSKFILSEAQHAAINKIEVAP